MFNMMEQAMHKGTFKAPEGLGKCNESVVLTTRREMSIQQEMRGMLWEAFPPKPHDNRKSWFTDVARSLGWKHRRVVAIFRCEARVVTAEEWKALHQRLDARKTEERREEELRAELRGVYQGIRRDRPLDV